MRGGWQGSGTWWTTGLDPAVAGVAVLAVAVIGIIEWIAAHLWELIAGTAAAAVLTAAGVLWLMRWTGRREAAWGAQRAALRAEQVREMGYGVTDSGPEIGTPVPDPHAIRGGLHIHFHGLAADEQVSVFRNAIGTTSGRDGNAQRPQ